MAASWSQRSTTAFLPDAALTWFDIESGPMCEHLNGVFAMDAVEAPHKVDDVAGCTASKAAELLAVGADAKGVGHVVMKRAASNPLVSERRHGRLLVNHFNDIDSPYDAALDVINHLRLRPIGLVWLCTSKQPGACPFDNLTILGADGPHVNVGHVGAR